MMFRNAITDISPGSELRRAVREGVLYRRSPSEMISLNYKAGTFFYVIPMLANIKTASCLCVVPKIKSRVISAEGSRRRSAVHLCH